MGGRLKNRGERWQKGETLNTVIGQGFMLSTPLQITLMTAMIATGKKIKSQRYFMIQKISLKKLKYQIKT